MILNEQKMLYTFFISCYCDITFYSVFKNAYLKIASID